MPRITDIEIIRISRQMTLSLRSVVKMCDLPAFIGDSYRRIDAYLKELGEFITDVPFTAYHSIGSDKLDVEVGFPVARALPGKGDIQPGFLPEGFAIFCMFRGSNSEMEPAYAEMVRWIEEHGCESAGATYEYYFNGPPFPKSELLTKIMMPVRKKQ